MSYITISERQQQRAMKILRSVASAGGDDYSDLEAEQDLEEIVKALGYDQILIAKGVF